MKPGMIVPEDTENQIVWNKARDLFLGLSGRTNRLAGLALAAQCKHQEAIHLCTLFKNSRIPKTLQEIKEVFLCDNTPMALCFAAVIGTDVDIQLLRQSAQRGYAKAKVLLAEWDDDGENPAWLAWMEDAAEQLDPTALCAVAYYYSNMDPAKSALLYNRASELNDAEGHYYHGKAFKKNDPTRYYYWQKAIEGRHIDDIIERLAARRIPQQFLFDLGEAFKQEIKSMRRSKEFTKSKLQAVQEAITVYNDVCQKAKKAIKVWLMIARRSRRFVAKDVATMVARMVYKQRGEWKESSDGCSKKKSRTQFRSP